MYANIYIRIFETISELRQLIRGYMGRSSTIAALINFANCESVNFLYVPQFVCAFPQLK
jgi:hypothetical protein